tara:strand:+ start:7967 stop:8266 length:300 start_codon:yes stop_codon:yes gene_type:complete
MKFKFKLRYFICTSNYKSISTGVYIYRGQILEMFGPLFKLSGTKSCPIVMYKQIDLKHWKEITYGHNISWVDRLSPWLSEYRKYIHSIKEAARIEKLLI